MRYKSIVAEGQTVEELEMKLNEKLEIFNPAIYTISSPSLFNADGKYVAICIVEPKLD